MHFVGLQFMAASDNMDHVWDNNNVHFGWCRDGQDVHVHVPRPAPMSRPGGLRGVPPVQARSPEAGANREDGGSVGNGTESSARGSQEEQTQPVGSSGVSLQ